MSLYQRALFAVKKAKTPTTGSKEPDPEPCLHNGDTLGHTRRNFLLAPHGAAGLLKAHTRPPVGGVGPARLISLHPHLTKPIRNKKKACRAASPLCRPGVVYSNNANADRTSASLPSCLVSMKKPLAASVFTKPTKLAVFRVNRLMFVDTTPSALCFRAARWI